MWQTEKRVIKSLFGLARRAVVFDLEEGYPDQFCLHKTSSDIY